MQTYAELPQQADAVNKEIDQLGSDELKSLLHAFVAFFSAEEKSDEYAQALIKELYEKYPTVIPMWNWSPQFMNLGIVRAPCSCTTINM